MSDPNILATAVAAWQAGLCPIRAATDGSKRPLGNWKKYQSERPDLDDVMVGFAHSENIGLVMGAISDRLVCIEFEGRFMENFDQVALRLRAADLYPIFKSWVDGYCESSPGGGLHVLIHVGGNGPVPGNIKIAQNAERETLIETRGEGGFLIIAPSNGSTHPSGGSWDLLFGSLDEIAWCTPEEFDAIYSCLHDAFDESPPIDLPTAPSLTSIQRNGVSWIDEALAQVDPMEVVLEGHGWTLVGHDSQGDLWKRPGKQEPGHSARVNTNGRLYVFSTATPFPVSNTTYDALDVDLTYKLGRVPMPGDRVDALRKFKRGMPGQERLLPLVRPVEAEPESELWLSPEFWSSRPLLQEIHDQSLGQMLSPEGVLGAFLSSYATTVPMSIKIPAIVGADSPLNTYSALVAKSGGGKTSAMHAALDLLGWDVSRNRDVLLNVGLRSGEGLITAANIPRKRTEAGADPSYRAGVQVSFDEGGVLSRQAERSGATVLPYLNQAWAGFGIIGGFKASDSASFPAELVRVCAVMGVQYGAAANLFTGEAAAIGFPQRLMFYGLSNPAIEEQTMTDSDVEAVKPVDVCFWQHGEFARNKALLQFPSDVIIEVRRWTQHKMVHGAADPLDGHKMLIRLRTAALFALMDGRGVVSNEDWEISCAISAMSIAIRNSLLRSLGDANDSRARALGHQDAVRGEAADTHWLEGKALRLSRRLLGVTDGLTRKEIRTILSSSEKRRIGEILDHAVARGLAVRRNGRYFEGGSLGGSAWGGE